MAKEFRAKGVHVALGPVVGPLGRITVSGRNWEGKIPTTPILNSQDTNISLGFSNDPYLCGALAADTIKGVQSVGVSTSTKVQAQAICLNDHR